MNEHEEKALEKELERIVQHKQSSGKAHLDALGQIRPIAEEGFVDNLEERLLAQLSNKPSKKELMMKRKEKPNVWRYPLTLAAAIIAIAIVGGLALFINQDNQMEVANAPMPTSIPQTTVVIALQDIEAGTSITPDMVALIRFPLESAPIDALSELEDVIGRVPQTNIYREEVIIGRKLDDSAFNPFGSNTPAAIGCTTDAARITSPENGTIIDAPIMIEGMADNPNFAEARLEISGPATDYRYVVLFNITDPRSVSQDIGQFVPSNYEVGVYRLRLSSYSNSGLRLGNCSIAIYIRESSAPYVEVVMAIEDIPDGRPITGDMLTTVQFPAEYAPVGAMTSIHDVVGLMPTSIIYREEIILSRKLVSSNAEEFTGDIGCYGTGVSIVSPNGGERVTEAITVEGVINILDFAQGKLEIAGPSTNGQYIVLFTFTERVNGIQELGQFVPANYESGAYRLRLTSSNTEGVQVGSCSIVIYITPPPSDENSANLNPDLMPMVIANQDIPLNARITEDMISLVYMPQDEAWQLAETNAGTWYLSEIDNVIGMESTQLIPAYQPINQNMISEADACTGRPLSTAECTQDLPAGYEAFILYTSDTSVANFMVGQHVDIVIAAGYSQTGDTSFQLSPINSDAQEIALLRHISDAIILYTEILPPTREENVLVGIAVPTASAQALVWIDNSDLPYMIVPHQAGENNQVPQHLDRTSNHNQVEIFISRNRVESIPSGLSEDDILSVNVGGETFTATLSIMGQHPATGDSSFADIYPSTLEPGEDVFGLRMNADDAQILKTLVEEGQRVTLDMLLPVENEVEMTAYYPIPENFIGNYDALSTDTSAMFIAVIPSWVPESVLEGIPVVRLGSNQRILAFYVVSQIGTYSRSREDGTVETGRSARLLLSTAEAGWLEQLRLSDIKYSYTLLPMSAIEHPVADMLADAPLEISVQSVGILANEAITIRNTSSELLDLSGWTLSDADGNEYRFGEQLLFANAQLAINTRIGNDEPVNLFWDLDHPILQAGEMLFLRDAEGMLIAILQTPSE